jgi:hypothetical protein
MILSMLDKTITTGMKVAILYKNNTYIIHELTEINTLMGIEEFAIALKEKDDTVVDVLGPILDLHGEPAEKLKELLAGKN